jgi:transposase
MAANNERTDCCKASLIPWDLKSWVSDRVLVRLALDAVQTVPLKTRKNAPEGISPQMMLTLLSYCYSVGIYGSQDIEWAVQHDRTVRYICAHNYPEWETIRWFRRHYRQQIKDCLAYVTKQAWALKFEEAEADYGGYGWFESDLNEEIRSLVDDKLDVAVVMDRVAIGT